MKQENLYIFLNEFTNYTSGFKIDNFIGNRGIQVEQHLVNCVSEDHDTCVHRNKRPTGLRGHLSYRLYTDFLSEELTFAYQQPHHRINTNQQWPKEAAL